MSRHFTVLVLLRKQLREIIVLLYPPLVPMASTSFTLMVLQGFRFFIAEEIQAVQEPLPQEGELLLDRT
jgi:hypothetical protein